MEVLPLKGGKPLTTLAVRGGITAWKFIDISTRIPANLFAGGIVLFFSKKKYAYPHTKISYLERSV